tara:strand:- start:8998 stop:10035 length:1038 start_codon:yes stop_codon:yes gene_type:complete
MTQYSPRKNNISLTHSTRKTQKALPAQDLSMANPNVFVTKNSSLTYIEQYIKALIANVDNSNIPKTINLIFDGGAFNAFYATGIALYLLELQKHNIKIEKVSGSSAGAGVAMNFLAGNFLYMEQLFDRLTTCLRDTHQLGVIPTLIRDNVYYLFNNDTTALDVLQDRLFISYYDVEERKQKVVSSYSSRDELVEYLIRTSFVPYLINGKSRHKNKYIDGISPYIFSDKFPNLFVKLITNGRAARCLMTKNEENPHHRIMAGVAAANDFFTTGSSNMCSYMHDWTITDNILFRGRTTFIFFVFTIIEWMVFIKRYIPNTFTESLMVQGLQHFVESVYHDMLHKLLL